MDGTSDRFGLRLSRDGWPPTAPLAVAGSMAFISGFFLMTVVGREFDARVYLLVLAAAAWVPVPLFLLGVVITLSESVVGRAWASGFRLLRPGERLFRGSLHRAVRYASFLCLANGGALWLATLAARVN